MEIVNLYMPCSTYADSRWYNTNAKLSAENCTALLLQHQQQQHQQQQQQQIIDQNVSELQNIDDLFDFSNEEISSVLQGEETEESTEEEAGLISICNSEQDSNTKTTGPSLLNDDDLFPSCEDRAELEWLSNFVDESMSSSAVALDGASALFGCCTVANNSNNDNNNSNNNNNNSPVDRQKSSEIGKKEDSIQSPGYGYHRNSCTVYREKESMEFAAGSDVCVVRAGGRARSKRARTTTGLLSRVWESRVILIDYRNAKPSPAENALFESPSSTSTLTDSEDDQQVLDYFPYSAPPPLGNKKQKMAITAVTTVTPKKKNKKATTTATTITTTSASLSCSSSEVKGDVDLSPATSRKCLHCATTKTPQWRAGPQGPKTLCNACGVRFKSGRLLPEYRPAASPTFIDCLHSNSHRRVLEMRKQKEDPNDEDEEADVDYNDHDNDRCRTTTLPSSATHSSWDTP